MVKVIWTKRAFSQFERIVKFIREDQGLSYARIVHERILESISFLEHHPQLGPAEPALKHKKSEYRFLVVWSYKVIYKVEPDRIIIARLFHTSRNPTRLKGI
jgi:toxin ParE1/3/4